MSRLPVRAALVALCAALAVWLGACSPKSEDRREVVSVWSTIPAPTLAPWVASFEAASPRLRVVVRTFAEDGFADSVVSALAAGRPPDLATLPSEALPRLLAAGVLSDWSAGVAAGGAYVIAASVVDAVLPLQAIGPRATPLLPYLVHVFPGEPMRAIALLRLRSAPYDTLALVVNRREGRWTLVDVHATVEP